MPITVSHMAAIQAMLNSQKAAIDVTVNAARDNVNSNVDADAAALVTVVNAARDNVKADTTAQLATQTTAINSNTDTKTSAVTTAVNAKGVVKSIQRGTAVPYGGSSSTNGVLSVTIAAVDVAKAVVSSTGSYVSQGGTPNYSLKLVNSTTLEIKGWTNSSAYTNEVQWQVVEHFG